MSGILFLAMSACVNAATLVSYSATDGPGADPDGTGSVNVWQTSIIGLEAGSFLGNSGSNGDGSGAGAGTSAWALYAHSGSQSFASHTFAGGSLGASQTVGLDFDNGYLDAPNAAGIQLRNGATVLFSLYFRGGQSVYEYLDAGGFDIDTSRGFSDDGAAFSFTLNSSTTYSASYGAASWTGTLSGASIDNIQVFNNNAGSADPNNVFFNNLSVIPEPSSAALGLIGAVLLLRRRRF